MASKGFHPKEIILNNEYQRFGGKPGEDNKWLIGHEVESQKYPGFKLVICTYGNWRTGEQHVFSPKGKVPKEDRAYFAQEQQKLQDDLKRKKSEERDRVAVNAKSLYNGWRKARWVPGYCKRKNITQFYGACSGIDWDGVFLGIPMVNSKGEIRNLQKIRTDGTKRFLKGGEKQGLFHVLTGAVDSDDVVFVAEGFATAATVADAMVGNDKQAIVCAFDAGNLIHVAKEIRRINVGAQLIICADNDKINPQSGQRAGIKSAQEAAEAVSGVIYLCPEEGKDFNDIGVDKTREFFKSNKSPTEEGRGTKIVPLGFNGDRFYFGSTYNRVLHELKNLTETELLKLAPLSQWQTMFPNKSPSGVDWLRARDFLFGDCISKGIFTPKKIRSIGVWQEDKEIIVHLGDRLWSSARGTLPLIGAGFESFYELRETQPDIHPTPLTAKESEPLQKLANKLSVEKNHGPMLVGWLASAILGGLLKWRPHVWLTGEQGSGKTTALNDLIFHLIGSSSVTLQGGSSEPALRRETRFKSCPVIFEEFESMSKKDLEAVEACVSFIRQASSDSIGGVVKASGESGTIAYVARFSACIASIKTELRLEQDKARFTVIDFIKGKTPWDEIKPLYGAISSREWAARYRSRIIHKAQDFLQAIEVLKDVMPGAQRFKDQHAPLWAGWWITQSDSPLTPQDAKDMLSFWLENDPDSLQPIISDQTEADECLEFLKTNMIDMPRGESVTVAEAIKAGIKTDISKPYREALENVGMKVDAIQSRVHIRANTAQLKRIFSQEPRWRNWTQALSRIAGAEKNKTTRYFGRPEKGIWIPYSIE